MPFTLDVGCVSDIEAYLHRVGLVSSSRGVEEATVPGKGNMNVVVRVNLSPSEAPEPSSSLRSLILKQSPPYAAAFPQVPAPESRLAVEGAWYAIVAADPLLAQSVPSVYHIDTQNVVMAMEDLGLRCEDMTSAYAADSSLSDTQVSQVAAFLGSLHGKVDVSTLSETQKEVLENLGMRNVSRDHIFRLPLDRDNGFDLDSTLAGLATLSEIYKGDKELVRVARELEEKYLAPAASACHPLVLLHGDYFPGSWFQADGGLKIIDPEFAFLGRPEFDVGVMEGHLRLCGHSEDSVRLARKAYKNACGSALTVDDKLIDRYAGLEMLRRIIGIAQLPMTDVSLDARAAMLVTAKALMLV